MFGSTIPKEIRDHLKAKEGVEKAQAAAQINVVLNWFSELQQRVPVK